MKTITPTEYKKKMDKLIAKKKPVNEFLIEAVQKLGKYKIK